jgi:hypothetical protein
MPDLNRRAYTGLLRLTFTLALCIFLPARTVHYSQRWVLLLVLFVSFLAITVYLMKNDPQLLGPRMNAGPAAERYRSHRIGQFFWNPGIHCHVRRPRIGPSTRLVFSSGGCRVGGDVVVVLELLIVFFVFKENSFTSATVEVIRSSR